MTHETKETLFCTVTGRAYRVYQSGGKFGFSFTLDNASHGKTGFPTFEAAREIVTGMIAERLLQLPHLIRAAQVAIEEANKDAATYRAFLADEKSPAMRRKYQLALERFARLAEHNRAEIERLSRIAERAAVAA